MDRGVRELSVQEAAAACGVSESTIRRHLPAFPGARRPPGESRGWLIPITDLLAQGFTIEARSASAEVPDADQAALAREIRELRAEIAELEKELDELDASNQVLRRRAEVAEALAGEREQTIQDLRLALSLVDAPRAATDVAALAGSTPTEVADPDDPGASTGSDEPSASDPSDAPPKPEHEPEHEHEPVGPLSGPSGDLGDLAGPPRRDLLSRAGRAEDAPTNRRRRIDAARETLRGIGTDR